MPEETSETSTVELATELTIAWLNNPNNRVSADEVPAFLERMHKTLNGLGSTAAPEADNSSAAQEYVPAVTARKSLSSPHHILSLIDGKPYKTLRRHLARHDLTPEQYRERYKLKSDYPMVAPTYSEHRRAMAHKIGLGAKRRTVREAEAAAPVAPAETPKAKRGPRRKAAPAAPAENAKPKRAYRRKAAPATE